MKDYEEKVINIMDSTKDNIRTQLDKAYKSGYEDAKSTLVQKAYKDGYADAKTELGKNTINLVHEERDRAYQQGLDEAWEVAKKIIHSNGLSLQKLMQIFGTAYFDKVLKENTASEAIAKIKEYEEKQKDTEQEQNTEIKVGDEVKDNKIGYIGIVITDKPSRKDEISVLFSEFEQVQLVRKSDLVKTGRHFDQIAEVLAKMRGDKE